MTKNVVHVAVAVVVHRGRYLLARRHTYQHQGGKLEFVGGKIEPSETPEQALVRELSEEIGLFVGEADVCDFLGKIEHDYGDKAVCLWVYRLGLSDLSFEQIKDKKTGLLEQAIFWYDLKTLLMCGSELPEANREILDWIKIAETK